VNDRKRDVDRELEAMAEDLAVLRQDDYRDVTRTRTRGALARLADFTRGVSSTVGGGRSTGVSNPTASSVVNGKGTYDLYAAHHAELQDCLTSASLALRRARSIVERAYPVPALEPPEWCTSCERIEKPTPATQGELCDFCAGIKAETKRIPNRKLLERFHQVGHVTTKDLRSA
jgi:hypothetical protein